ncbi:hypothetical protein PoB_002301600 [Plakobranchus ocellatus]|uniref:Uncharacterized protein n=1 Tax=Plakobranchus ocellatus TaxID=259542 RepID=A0AAV3ZKP7_9GAST|nr:hypothetical protein PoB_002301600 [Plakobranchus ocellatus]
MRRNLVLRLLHGSPEEYLQHVRCRTYGNPVLPSKNTSQKLGSPSRVASISQFSAFRQICGTVTSCSARRQHTIVAGHLSHAQFDRRSVCLALERKIPIATPLCRHFR